MYNMYMKNYANQNFLKKLFMGLKYNSKGKLSQAYIFYACCHFVLEVVKIRPFPAYSYQHYHSHSASNTDCSDHQTRT